MSKQRGRFLQFFVAFSENLKFILPLKIPKPIIHSENKYVHKNKSANLERISPHCASLLPSLCSSSRHCCPHDSCSLLPTKQPIRLLENL